jgi:ABC-type multidrug transport system ATPase subunit
MAVTAPLDAQDVARDRAAGSVILLATDITKRWGNGNEPVLGGVNLELRGGSLIGLQGANGAGKTTLLRILGGLFLPDSGTIALDGLNPVRDRRAYQRRLGFLAAGQGGLYARLSAKEHLNYWASIALLPVPERRAAVTATLERFDLLPMAAKRADRLSTGQRQRLRLAMAFLHDPDVILLDEPSNSLDDAGIALLESLLQESTRAGKSVVWCAPAMPTTGLQFDAVHQLADGKLRQL